MSRKRTPFDHHLDAVRLLARADEHLRWIEEDENTKSGQRELIASLRADIAAFLDKRYPS